LGKGLVTNDIQSLTCPRNLGDNSGTSMDV
jgi:hypothetical protein